MLTLKLIRKEMKRFLLCVAFVFVGVLAGCDSLKSDNNDDSNGNTEGDGETTMVLPGASARYA